MIEKRISLNKHRNQMDYAIAGACGGFVSRAFVQPLDVIKIRFQLQVEPIKFNTDGKYRGIVQAAKSIYREEGLRAFWKGHVSSQIQAVSFSLVQFSVFELCNVYIWHKLISERNKQVSTLISLKSFISGGMAGSVATIFTQPFDVLRTRFASQGEPKVYKTISSAMATILKNEGFHGFFRGLVPSLLLIAPQTGFQFLFYHLSNNILTRLLTKWRNKGEHRIEVMKIGLLQSALSGGLAGSMAKVCVYPFDIIKKRMQVQGFESARSKFGRLHISSGFFKCIRVIFLTEGVGGFFKGLQTSIIKSFFSLGLRFSVYEQVCSSILSLRERD